MTERFRVALDTNILVYAMGFNDPAREAASLRVIAAFHPEELVLPAQAMGELYAVGRRKVGLSAAEARQSVEGWSSRLAVVAAAEEQFMEALDVAGTHGLQFWDALILATAARAGCRLLLSEDMQDGFVWKGCTVANPFAPALHPLLADVLAR
jgi:predicted nucleic acid-binding protein